MPTALITGINGQDGSYLAEFLLLKGYRVVGTTPNAAIDQERIVHIRESLEIVETDLLDQQLIEGILGTYKPNEIYNLAAHASSLDLWTEPGLTGELNAIAVARLLNGIYKVDQSIRFFQASSSEMFGNPRETPQTELTPFHPRNPYGVSKLYGHWMTVIHREQRSLFACAGILYNHESPRRGLEFVSRKVSQTVAKISLGEAKELRLGRLDARRDWGFAGDYQRAMWLMLQQPNPDDYIIATGEAHSVRDFCRLAFAHVNLDYHDFVIEDAAHDRPVEHGLLVGDPAKARHVLKWRPSITFEDLVRMMVEADLKSIRQRQQQTLTSGVPS